MVEVYQMVLDQPCIDQRIELGFIGLLSSVLKYNQDQLLAIIKPINGMLRGLNNPIDRGQTITLSDL